MGEVESILEDTNLFSITFMNNKALVSCDQNCSKAWGRNSRPIKNQKEYEDSNFEVEPIYFADEELGDAPADPGTSEGGEIKPGSPEEFPNKWCVRECERCSFKSLIGKYHE